MRVIFLQTLIESLASIHDKIPGICWQCFEIRPQIAKFMGPTWVLSAPDGPHVGPMNLAIRGVKYRGVRGPRAYFPALFYCHTTNCGVHFEIDTFIHNDRDGYVQCFTNLTQNRLSYPNGRIFLINLRPPIVTGCIRHIPKVIRLWLFQRSYVWNLFLEDGHLW